MLVRSRTNVHRLLAVVTRKLVLLGGASVAAAFVADSGYRDLLFPATTTGVLIGSASIFLAFRINVGYGRWSQGRQIWGSLVPANRNLALYVISMMRLFSANSADDREFKRRFVYRQIGYVNALRLQLRRQEGSDWDGQLWKRTVNGRALFSPDEMHWVQDASNKALQILTVQTESVSEYFKERDQLVVVKILELISDISSRQGQAEGLKSTVLAWGYAFYTKMLAYCLAIVVILSELNAFAISNIVLVTIVATIFLTIEEVGRNLDNPFDGSFNDTPMSSLCRTIEINLLQQIGEPCSLEPLGPVGGRLD